MLKARTIIESQASVQAALSKYKDHLNWDKPPQILAELQIAGQKFWKFFVAGQNKTLLLADTSQIVESWEVKRGK